MGARNIPTMTSPALAAATATELEDFLCFDLYAASRAVTAAYRPILEPLGLTYPQYLVLVMLWSREEVAIKEVAAALRLDHATLTPLLRRMETAGLVTRRRDGSDERIVLVTLAPAGRSLEENADQIECRISEAVGLTRAQMRELQQMLRMVAGALSRVP